MTRTRGVTVAGFALVLAVAPLRADAQVPPPPAEGAPVYELLAPTVSPVCENALLAVGLGPSIVAGALGLPLPPQLVQLFGPVVVICGAIPAPPQRLRCAADHSIRGAVDTVTAEVAGIQLPIDTSAVGPAVEQVVVLQDNFPPPLDSAGVAEQAVSTLDCKPAATPESPAVPAPAGATDETPPIADEVPELALPDFTDAGRLLPSLGAAPPLTQFGPVAPPAGVEPVAAFGGPGFAYPVVFALPLLLLVIGGYLGRALTRSVEPPQP